MQAGINAHPKGRPTLTVERGLRYVWIAVRGSDEPHDPGIALHLKGVSFETARIACEAFNAAMSGPTDAELAPTQPAIPQAAE